MTIQANLLFNDRVFLERGESERAVRTLFNNFAQNLYRDVNCFTEHPITDFGIGFGPFYKTPDEAQFIVNLRNHLLLETGDTLRLLPGVPRDWLASGKTLSFERMATFFGPIGVNVTVGPKEIELTMRAEWRKAPGTLAVCLRTPDRKTPASVSLNGEPLPQPVWKGETLLLNHPSKSLCLTVKY